MPTAPGITSRPHRLSGETKAEGRGRELPRGPGSVRWAGPQQLLQVPSLQWCFTWGLLSDSQTVFHGTPWYASSATKGLKAYWFRKHHVEHGVLGREPQWWHVRLRSWDATSCQGPAGSSPHAAILVMSLGSCPQGRCGQAVGPVPAVPSLLHLGKAPTGPEPQLPCLFPRPASVLQTAWL